MSATLSDCRAGFGHEEFSHEALLYAGIDDWAAGVVPFVRDGVAASQPVLVAVSADKIDLLKAELGAAADEVQFADMAVLGRNPARIIPAWSDFLASAGAGGRRVRGVGEPIWATRSPAELVECQRHEQLLNYAFAGSGAWRLLCPYDTAALAPDVIDEARRSHPLIIDRQGCEASPTYTEVTRGPYSVPLPEPPGPVPAQRFGAGDVTGVRLLAWSHAAMCGFDDVRADDFALSAHEIATNSLRHGGGHGELRLWREGPAIVCEIGDQGLLEEPLAGRVRPDAGQTGGRGLWLANQLCDLVQIRSYPGTGTVVRLRMNPPTA